MKKTLIAFAALTAIAGAAQAQSTVTLYGIADANVGRNSSTTLTNNAGVFARSKVTQTAVDSGGLANSRFGFRGVEDLGSGLKAVFTMEGGISVDTGAGNGSGGGLFSRQAFVGLNGNFGQATLGRHLTAYDALRGATNYSDNALLFSFTQINQVFSSGVADYTNRSSNSFLYTSPTYSGFSGSFLLGGGEDKSTALKASRNNSFHVKYVNGPLLVGYGYQNEKFNPNATASNINGPTVVTPAGTGERKYNLFAGSYDFGVAKLTGSYQAAKQENSGLAVNNRKDKEFQTGVSVPFGAATISAGYVRSKTDGSPLKATGYSLLGTYSLSKRTNVYAGYIDQKYSGLTVAAGSSAVEKRSAFATGVRHAF